MLLSADDDFQRSMATDVQSKQHDRVLKREDFKTLAQRHPQLEATIRFYSSRKDDSTFHMIKHPEVVDPRRIFGLTPALLTDEDGGFLIDADTQGVFAFLPVVVH